MSEFLNKKAQKKEAIKNIILDLHKGLLPEDAKKRFDEEIGSITSSEIAEIEQSLINEGMSTDEIKKFCNVHALLFESSLKQLVLKEEAAGHPVHTFKLENTEIEKLTTSIKNLAAKGQDAVADEVLDDLKKKLVQLKNIELHYVKKEQLLFPFLEKHGFMGPSKVMWGKHNEIRDLLKNALMNIEKDQTKKDFNSFKQNYLDPLIEEVTGMIFKEENILFPASMEKLNSADWVDIIKESDEIGYAFIEKPRETSSIVEDLKKNVAPELKIIEENIISLPTGCLKLKERMWILDSLPFDITFIDRDDTVKYFSDNKERIFVRTKSIIGRKVQNCHPPQSVDTVEKILSAFKQGSRNSADFWINFNSKLIFIKFLAIRDENSNYLGTVEITMDITEFKNLEGEKRLLDEENQPG